MFWSEQPEWAPPTGEPHWSGRILLLKAEQVLSFQSILLLRIK